MNKLIASAAIIAASTALAGATVTTVDIVDLLDTTNAGYVDTSNNSSSGYVLGTSSVSAEGVAYAFGATTGIYADYTSGSFVCGAGNLNNGNSSIQSEEGSNSVSSFYLNVRSGYSGEWAAVIVSVSTILAAESTATTDDLTSISISYSVTDTTSSSASTYAADGYPLVTAWVVSETTTTTTDDDGNETETITASAVALTVTTTLETDESDSAIVNVSGSITGFSNLSEDDIIVILFASDATSSTTTTDLSLTTTIPEPSAFAMLAGVGALAFAVSRRRRSRKA